MPPTLPLLAAVAALLLGPGAQSDPKDALAARLRQKREEALGRLGEAKESLAKERADAQKAEQSFRDRMAKKPIDFAFRGGEIVKGAILRDFTPHDAGIDAAGKPRRFLWDALQPASVLAAADAVFDRAKAKDQYDQGRFLIARRMWKEAKEAFDRAAKLGDGYESEVLAFSDILERLLSEHGAFRGTARRLGRDGIRIAYDFSDAAQLGEFTAGLALEGKSAVLAAKGPARVFLRGGAEDEPPVSFLDELSAELRITADGPVTFLLFAGDAGGWAVELGPAGTSLHKVGADGKRKTLKTDARAKLAAGKPAEVRLVSRGRSFTVHVDKAEALSAADPPSGADDGPAAGAFGFSIEKGKLTIGAPMTVQGRMAAADLDKRIGEVEVLLRRALDDELVEIRERRERRMALEMLGETEDRPLSAEDSHFEFRIKTNADLDVARALKATLAKGAFGPGQKWTAETWAKTLDAMIAKYPDVPSLLYTRARFRQERQDVTGAAADLKAALAIFPEFHEAHRLDAQLRLQAHDLDGALASSNRAIDLRPDFTEAYVTRALVTYSRGTGSAQAYLDDLELARKLDPTEPDAGNWIRILRYQARGPRDLGCRFEHETEHYKIMTDISPEAAKRYGENLEAAFGHFRTSLKHKFPRGYGRKPRVAVFNTAENYYTYFELLSESRGEHTLGVFRPALNELVLFESLDFELAHHVLYHEATHHYMAQLAPHHLPFWYNEGIAEYLGAIAVKDGKVTEKAKLLKERLGGIKWAVEVGNTFPFPRLMMESPREFYGPGAGLKYAQAWSMIHFFYEGAGGKHRPLIERYLELLLGGATPQKAFDDVFAGKTDPLEAEWKAFVKGLK